MFSKLSQNKKSGFTLIEMLVFLFIFVVTVVAFYQAFALGINYILESKNRIAAAEVANEKMEIIRSLPYASIGTKTPNGSGGWIYGIPSGDILSTEAVSENGHAFTVTTLVQNIADPIDGNPLSTGDYKRARVQVSWSPTNDPQKSVFVISTFVPQGLSTAAGGDVSVNVQDDTGAPIGQASVILSNPVTDVLQTYPADAGGNAKFLGVPQDTTGNYNIQISKAGYFPVQTYPPYNPLVPGSFTPVDKNLSVTNGTLWPVTITTDKLATLTIDTKDMLGNSLPNVNFSLAGGRVMGTTVPAGAPVYSYSGNLNSGSSGKVAVTNPSGISGGTYTFTVASPPANFQFVKLDASTTKPAAFPLAPGATSEVRALFEDTTKDSFMGTVIDQSNNLPIQGATVELANVASSYDVTLTTDQFGNVYFPDNTAPLTPVQYTVTVKATNYDDLTGGTVTINKLTTKTFSMTKS